MRCDFQWFKNIGRSEPNDSFLTKQLNPRPRGSLTKYVSIKMQEVSVEEFLIIVHNLFLFYWSKEFRFKSADIAPIDFHSFNEDFVV